MNKKDILVLSFALGNNISLRCVMGLHTLLSMDATLNLPLGKLVYSEFNLSYPLLLDPAGKGLPDGVSLPASNLCVPPGVPSNLTPLVHHTTIDGFSHLIPNHATPSKHIIVHSRICHGSVSRNLSFSPSSKNPVT